MTICVTTGKIAILFLSDDRVVETSRTQDPDEAAKKVEIIIRSIGAIVWALAWLWDRIENPAIERRRQRGIDKRAR